MIITITKNEDHLVVDYFRQLIPSKKIKRTVSIINEIIILIFLAIFFYATLSLSLDVIHHKTPALAISRSLLYFSMPVSIAGMFIMTLVNIFSKLINKEDSKSKVKNMPGL